MSPSWTSVWKAATSGGLTDEQLEIGPVAHGGEGGDDSITCRLSGAKSDLPYRRRRPHGRSRTLTWKGTGQ